MDLPWMQQVCRIHATLVASIGYVQTNAPSLADGGAIGRSD